MDLLFIAPQGEGNNGGVVETGSTPATPNATPGAITDGATADGQPATHTEVSGDKGSEEQAGDAAAAQGGGYGFWIMIGAMILIMYFFMWRPEKKRRKQMEQFRQGIKKGDHVITAGGIYGTVKEVHETSILIETEGNTTLRVDKNMVVGDPSNGTAR
jgi:preprotein translocase subunit YajC